MTTIGYGSRSQTEQCPAVFLAVMLQSILGAGLQFALASIAVSKMRKAKRRCGTILFSDQVCLYEQDTRLHLAVRVGDMRRSDIVGAHAQGYMVKKSKSKDGSFVPVRIFNVSFRSESGRDELFLSWPTEILHKVDEESPLWALSRDELLSDQYELIVVIDGVSGATSQPFQARKSYHASEMRWGQRFSSLDIEFTSTGTCVMNLANFHHTIPASTPLCSAQDVKTLRQMYRKGLDDDEEPTDARKNGKKGANYPAAVPENIVKPRVATTKLVTRSARPDSLVTSVSQAYRKALRAKRSVSMVENPTAVLQRLRENPDEEQSQRNRRCSLGDLIRESQGAKGVSPTNSIPFNIYDALNIYRHRRSITDTYLGAEIEEEEEKSDDAYSCSSNQAILTIMSHVSGEQHIDVRDVFKKRKSSAAHLYFAPEQDSGDENMMAGAE
ncbi:inward rectifier potassium channel 4 [Plakobranchus ocellatus]|uniref:Inward rectifier potassium channel 4 n=1 Tax=Plakobranchus ocellatus TaxID=259542 RepID=A0AAV3YUT7_9GAST|nr:inward rectifier potassium channel 4 [Plakobranchus ocellatus]